MAENWIKVEPVFKGKTKRVKNMYCKVIFSDSVSIILDDDDRDYLIEKLMKHKVFKKMFEKVTVDG